MGNKKANRYKNGNLIGDIPIVREKTNIND